MMFPCPTKAVLVLPNQGPFSRPNDGEISAFALFDRSASAGNAREIAGENARRSLPVRGVRNTSVRHERPFSPHRGVTAIGAGAPRYQANRPRYPVSIPRDPISHAAGRLGVSRERFPREERQSRYI